MRDVDAASAPESDAGLETRVVRDGSPTDSWAEVGAVMCKVLVESARREVFRALVELQDRRLSVGSSREEVARQYLISVPLVCLIEREGIRKEWPPLSQSRRTTARRKDRKEVFRVHECDSRQSPRA